MSSETCKINKCYCYNTNDRCYNTDQHNEQNVAIIVNFWWTIWKRKHKIINILWYAGLPNVFHKSKR